MSKISTKEDEIKLLVFTSSNKTISSTYESAELIFTSTDSTVQIDHLFPSLTAVDRLSCFLVELDNETFTTDIIDKCQNWILQDSFPKGFNQLDADKLLGDDDLLGMKTLTIDKINVKQSLIFEGLQLFDRYRYELKLEGF